MRVVLLTAITLCAFAANSLLCRAALAHTAIDPASFTAVRMLSGAAALAVIVRLAAAPHRAPFQASSWPAALALFCYAIFFSFAYVSLTAATGALLLFVAVQVTMISYGLYSGERLHALQWGGLGLAVVGLAILLAPGVAAPTLAGGILMSLAGFAWGVYSLLGRTSTMPLAATAGNFLRAAPLSLPLLLLPGTSWDLAGVGWALASGVIASGLGYAIWYAALPLLTAATAATVQLLVPLIAAVSGVVLLGEPLTLQLLVASAAILGGIAIVVRRKRN